MSQQELEIRPVMEEEVDELFEKLKFTVPGFKDMLQTAKEKKLCKIEREREWQRKYKENPDNKEKIKKWHEAYNSRPDIIAKRRAYTKAYQPEYNKRPEVIARKKKRSQDPVYREKEKKRKRESYLKQKEAKEKW